MTSHSKEESFSFLERMDPWNPGYQGATKGGTSFFHENKCSKVFCVLLLTRSAALAFVDNRNDVTDVQNGEWNNTIARCLSSLLPGGYSHI